MKRFFARNRIAVCLILLVFSTLPLAESRSAAADERPAGKLVQMAIDYGDGVEKRFSQLRWTAGMTVLDALQVAAKHPRGIEFQHRGSGATAFVYKIDDLENEGRGRNWIFSINGDLAERSCGVTVVLAGVRIHWIFG